MYASQDQSLAWVFTAFLASLPTCRHNLQAFLASLPTCPHNLQAPRDSVQSSDGKDTGMQYLLDLTGLQRCCRISKSENDRFSHGN